jgi:hypothetical protein
MFPADFLSDIGKKSFLTPINTDERGLKLAHTRF